MTKHQEHLTATYNPIPQMGAPRSGDKRHMGRVACEAVTCTLGEVLNASAAGLRVQLKGKPPAERRDIIGFNIHGPDGAFPVKAQVIWMKKRGFRRHEMGLQIIDPDISMRRKMGRTIAGAREKAAYYHGLNRPKNQF